MQGMKEHYKVRLVARNEGIEYSDKNGVYRFNVALTNREWRVSLPGSKGKEYKTYDLTDAERSIVLPRVKAYLESRRYLGLVGPTYPVVFQPVQRPVSSKVD
jgi:hypothetical protein